jgi:hypothetical protein
MLSGSVPVNPETNDYLDATVGLRKYSDHPITLVDALLARMTRRLEAPVWTFDRHFVTMRTSVWKSDLAGHFERIRQTRDLARLSRSAWHTPIACAEVVVFYRWERLSLPWLPGAAGRPGCAT